MRADERVGTRLGDRTLMRAIGTGGMATVYEAVHRNGHRVAVKMLHASLATSEGSRRRFRRESYVVNRIEHDAVVRIFDDGEAPDGTPYLVLELLRGASVGTLLRQCGRLPLEQSIRLTDQLLGALISAHAAGVVHRDLKPDNLFVLEDGRLKVLDFGIARMFEEIEGATVHTQHGAVLGTPAFMAQEQARGRWSEVGERTDLWAAAATLFAMLAGEPVHAGGTPNEQLGRAMTMPARSLRSARADLPDALIRFVDRALEFEPARRWPSAVAMRDALRTACPEISAPEPSEARTVSMAPPAQPSSNAATTVSEIRSLDSAAHDRSQRGLPRAWVRAMGIALVAVLAAVFALVVIGRPQRAPAEAVLSPSPPTAELGHPSVAPMSAAIAQVAGAPPQPVSPELVKNPSVEAEVAAPAASSVTSTRPTPGARGRMIQGAPGADADRRSPPAHVAPPPNMFEIRH